uniref:Uncharacterized protein n=1 Tax=Anguilla anguilla TaxID=7936 RepID=A0A0E9SXT6_ANGAN
MSGLSTGNIYTARRRYGKTGI